MALDVAIQERIESDQLIEKLNITRLDAMQRKLVHQIETGSAIQSNTTGCKLFSRAFRVSDLRLGV